MLSMNPLNSYKFFEWKFSTENSRFLQTKELNFHPVQRWKINEWTQIESQMKLISCLFHFSVLVKEQKSSLFRFERKIFIAFSCFLWRNCERSLPLILFIFHSTVTWGKDAQRRNFSNKSDARHWSFTNNISLQKNICFILQRKFWWIIHVDLQNIFDETTTGDEICKSTKRSKQWSGWWSMLTNEDWGNEPRVVDAHHNNINSICKFRLCIQYLIILPETDRHINKMLENVIDGDAKRRGNINKSHASLIPDDIKIAFILCLFMSINICSWMHLKENTHPIVSQTVNHCWTIEEIDKNYKFSCFPTVYEFLQLASRRRFFQTLSMTLNKTLYQSNWM